MLLVSHPVGNQNVRALIEALSEVGALHSFHTSINAPRSKVSRLLPFSIKRQLDRRSFDGVNADNIVTYPCFDLARLISLKLKLNYLVDNKEGIFRPENLYKYVDRKVADYITNHEEVDSVYGYDGKCLKSFEAVKKRGGLCIYEAAFGYMPYVKSLLDEERILKPDWAELIPYFSNENLVRQKKELELADKVVVASSFAKRAVDHSGYQKSTKILPYGGPKIVAQSVESRNSKKLKIIYVGALSQQKGISYFFDAIQIVGLKYLDVTVVGQDISRGRCQLLRKSLENVTYINSLPHSDVLKLMESADVLILPSIAEAFGLVVTEAMSRGVVVIATVNCGASDIIDDGVNGYKVPIRCAKSIASKIIELFDRDKLNYMSKSAMAHATVITWEKYKSLAIEMLEVWDAY